MTESGLFRDLRGFDYRLWIVLVLQLLIPTVWLTVRVYFIGDMPDSSGIDIASQLMWINLLYEVFQEALVVPLYYVLGSSVGNRAEFVMKVRGGLMVVTCVYLVFALVICIFAHPIVSLMGQDVGLMEQTVQYVRLETVAALFSTLVRFMVIVLVTLHMDRLMYMVLLAQMVLTVGTDSILISSLPFSLDLGVNGIAYSNMIVNGVILVIVLAYMCRMGYGIIARGMPDTGWMREWARVGAFSGAESFLRNLVFMLMVVRLVNLVADQGDYWIANNFIRNWLLIPFIALGDVVKKQVAEDIGNIRTKTSGYVMFTIVLLILMYASIPAWPWFIENIMNTDHYESVYMICIAMLLPYSTYVFNNIMDSTFSGTGNTQNLLIQSICIDGIYYSCVFLLYYFGVFVPDLSTIVMMFGVGMMLDLIPATLLYVRLLRRNGIRINWGSKIY